MSLIERIAERNYATAQSAAQSEQAIAEEEAKPNAGATRAEQRAGFSGALAAGPDQELDLEAPSLEEQEEFTRAEKALAEAVFGAKSADSLVAAVMGSEDPVQGVGTVAADLVGLVNKKMKLSEDVMFALGESAVEQLTELVESSHPEVDLSEDQMAEALSIGVTTWMEGNQQMVDPEMSQYLAEEPPAQL